MKEIWDEQLRLGNLGKFWCFGQVKQVQNVTFLLLPFGSDSDKKHHFNVTSHPQSRRWKFKFRSPSLRLWYKFELSQNIAFTSDCGRRQFPYLEVRFVVIFYGKHTWKWQVFNENVIECAKRGNQVQNGLNPYNPSSIKKNHNGREWNGLHTLGSYWKCKYSIKYKIHLRICGKTCWLAVLQQSTQVLRIFLILSRVSGQSFCWPILISKSRNAATCPFASVICWNEIKKPSLNWNR